MGPGPRQERGRFGSSVAHHQMREFLRPLVVGNAAEDRSAKRKQIDEPDALFNARATQGCVGLEAVDLRIEIAQRNRTVREHSFGRVRSAGRRRSVGSGNHGAVTLGGLGGARYGKTLDDQAIGASMPSLMRGPFPPLM